MRLGAVWADDMVNALYRIVVPMNALAERGHELVGVKQRRGVKLPIDELVGCDLVHIHRLFLVDDDDDTVARLKEAGVVVGLDDDDDMVAAPDEYEEFIAEGSLEIGRRDFARLLARAPEVDLVTTPSDAIADRFEDAGAGNVQVVDNYVPEQFLDVRPRGHDGLVIGWHACAEHAHDLRTLPLADALARVLDKHDDVHVVTIGIDLGLEHERYRREENVQFDRLTQRLADFDIGLVPLADNDFNRARSNVKAREYAAAGVPWLASPVGSYRHLGKDEGGQLVEDDEWFDAIDQLVRSRIARAQQRRRAANWGRRESIGRMASLWEEVFMEAIDEAQAA